MQILIPQVQRNDAVNFSKVWNHNGVSVILNDVAIDFATDYTNIVLKSLVESQIKAMQAQQAPVIEGELAGGTNEVSEPNVLVSGE